MPENETKNKQNQETVGNTEKGREKQGVREEGRERDRDKLNLCNLNLELNLPKGIFWSFQVYQPINPHFVFN